MTVVVPTVDRVAELERALRSVLEQDYPGEIEVIVVFDGTNPRDLQLDVPPRRQVRTMRNTRTKGLAGNRNTGYLAATGDLISTCDDDDEWVSGKVSAQVELLRRHPGSEVVVSGCEVRTATRTYVRRPPTVLRFDDLLLARHPEIPSDSILVWREALLSGIGLLDERLTEGYGEDYEWLLRAARRAPVLCVPDPLVVVHWHAGSYFVRNWTAIDNALTYLVEKVPEFATCPRGLARVEGQIALARAAVGDRRGAASLAVRSLRRSASAKHSWAALAVASDVISADRLVALANKTGRGV